MALDILTATLQIKKQRSNTLKFLKKKKKFQHRIIYPVKYQTQRYSKDMKGCKTCNPYAAIILLTNVTPISLIKIFKIKIKLKFT